MRLQTDSEFKNKIPAQYNYTKEYNFISFKSQKECLELGRQNISLFYNWINGKKKFKGTLSYNVLLNFQIKKEINSYFNCIVYEMRITTNKSLN